MRTRVWLTALVLCVCCCGGELAVFAQTRELTNGGFEEVRASGEAVDWAPFLSGDGSGVEVVSEAHSGQRALRLWARTEKAVAGLNREFGVDDPGTMVERNSGRFTFWYQAVSSSVGGKNLCLTAIAMREKPITEVTRVNFVAPAEHVGDGQWHQGSLVFDFRDNPEVRYVHLGARVNEAATNGEGELLIDDLRVEPLGIILRVSRCGPSKPLPRVGEGFEIRCVVENRGDLPAAVVMTLEVPEKLELSSPVEQSVRTLVPLGRKESLWKMRAAQEGPAICSVKVGGGDKQESRGIVVVVRPQKDGEPLWNWPGRHVQLAIMRAGDAAVLEIANAGGECVGLVPLLGAVTTLRADGAPETLFLPVDSFLVPGWSSAAAFQLGGRAQDSEGGWWSAEVLVRPEWTTEWTIRWDARLTTDRERQLVGFNHLLLYAGEGAWGAEKDEALFGGLEYLEDGEESSSTLDIRAPEHVRYVPHPNKVTLPLMAVRHGETVVGMWWDPLQTWDADHWIPSPVFASPNTFLGQNNHLMGLMVPPVPEWTQENELVASKPVDLRPGQNLFVKAMLFCLQGDDVLDAAALYCRAAGLPEPMPLPEGTPEREIQFSTRAYLDTLWLPEEEKWHNTLDNDPWPISVNSTYIKQLWLASHLVPYAKVAAACRERAQKYMPQVGGPPAADLAFHLGRVRESLNGMQGLAEAEMASQGEDGSWRFAPSEQAKTLGEPGEEALGLNTQHALSILRFARITGDAKALGAGLKTLRHMEKFRVPRAAQVWEVPVHAPDILAAALGCEAYVEGYEATGDEQWLEDAVRWAKSGLPFLYFWNEADRPWMRYASIPVFGSTFWTHSWFGRAVQWNGLDYGRALFRLAEHDDSLPWRKVAVGVTHSGVLQQDREGRHAALYPDSYDAMTNAKVPWMLAPVGIMRNLMAEMNAPVEPETTVVATDGIPVRVTACAPISGATYNEGAGGLRFRVGKGLGERTFVLVCGVSRPTSVRAGDAVLEELPDDPMRGGFRYFDDASALVVGLDCARLPGVVEVAGVEARPSVWVRPAAGAIEWDFSQGAQGWFAWNALTPLTRTAKGIATTSTGGDPYMAGPLLNVEASRYREIVVSMSVSAGTGAQMYWTTKESPNFAEDKVVNIGIVGDGVMRDYVFPVAGHPNWKGTITRLRLDPSNVAGAEIEIERIGGR